MAGVAEVEPFAETSGFPPQFAQLLGELEGKPPVSSERTALVEAAIRVWHRPGFDTFAGLSELRFDPFDYQLRAASVVLRQMGGRAILVDEVGLGKTIEAGIVLSELRQRGLASDVLASATLAPPRRASYGRYGHALSCS